MKIIFFTFLYYFITSNCYIRCSSVEYSSNSTVNVTLVSETLVNMTLANETLANGTFVNETIVNATLVNETLVNGTLANGTLVGETLVNATEEGPKVSKLIIIFCHVHGIHSNATIFLHNLFIISELTPPSQALNVHE